MKVYLLSLFSLYLGGCVSMFEYKDLSPQQRVALVECKGSLASAKNKLKKADFDILDDKEDFFYTDWKLNRDPYYTELWPDGVFLKYKVRKKQNGKIEWSEIKSSERSDARSVIDDFYGGPKPMARQNSVRAMICDDPTPEILTAQPPK